MREVISAVVRVSKTPHLSKAGKHLSLWLVCIQELVHDGGVVTIVHIRSECNLVVIDIKCLPRDLLQRIEIQLVDKEITKRSNQIGHCVCFMLVEVNPIIRHLTAHLWLSLI